MSRPFGIRKVEWRVRIPKDLAGRIEHILADKRYNKAQYGIRSALVTRLLTEWVEGINAKTIPLPDLDEEEDIVNEPSSFER